MPDITLSVVITRTLLSLANLELNDHLNFVAAPSSPGQVQWQRQQVSSPWVDGAYTVNRHREQVMEELTFEVKGSSDANLQTNLGTIVAAFSQANFTITSTFNGTAYAWACEAADYQVVWDGPRHVAKQLQVRFTVPRSPIPTSGPI